MLPGMGYLPDLPSLRDYTSETDKVNDRLASLGEKPVNSLLRAVGAVAPMAKLPATSDLRQWCSPIEDQDAIGSCGPHAGIAIIEYSERRAFGTHVDLSRLFVYKTTRNLMRLTGDTGVYLRSAMQALTTFGAPLEEYYPYNIKDFDNEPLAAAYAMAANYKSLTYFRLDPPGISRQDLLNSIKTRLAAKIPCMFGFTVYSSYVQSNSNGGLIPFPSKDDREVGGHAVCIVGHDDAKKVTNTGPSPITTSGAFIIRNSWSDRWGDKGYGWLPYEYILSGLANDFWCVTKTSWIDSGQFRI